MAYFEALEAVKESPDADHNFTPTLLVVPSQLIVQTHREAIENFTGLDIQFFYGSAGDLALLGNTRTVGLNLGPWHCATDTPLYLDLGVPRPPTGGGIWRAHFRLFQPSLGFWTCENTPPDTCSSTHVKHFAA